MKTVTFKINKPEDYKLLLQLAKRLGIHVSGKEKTTAEIRTMAKHKGILTDAEAEQFQDHVKQSRMEWNRNS